MDPTQVLLGALPALAAGLLLALLGGARLLPLAAAVGLYTACGFLKGWPLLPNELWQQPNGIEWLVWCVAAAALLGLLEHFRVWDGRWADVTAGILGAASAFFVQQKLATRWASGESLLYVGGGGLAIALVVLLTRRALANARPGRLPALAVGVLFAADAAVLLVLGSTALYGQLCGALAAVAGGAAVAVRWRKSFAMGAGDGTWIGLSHGLFLLLGAQLADLPWAVAGPGALAPVLLFAGSRRLGGG